MWCSVFARAARSRSVGASVPRRSTPRVRSFFGRAVVVDFFSRVGRRIDFLVEIFPRRGVIPRTHTSHQCLLSSRPPLSPASPPSRRRRSKYVIVVIYVSHRIASSSSSSSSSRARAARCVRVDNGRAYLRALARYRARCAARDATVAAARCGIYVYEYCVRVGCARGARWWRGRSRTTRIRSIDANAR